MKTTSINTLPCLPFRQHNISDAMKNTRFTNRCIVLTIIINTCLLTQWCRVLLEKLTCLQLVKKFPTFHGTRRFITALTSVRHLSLSWASPIQSIPHPTSWRYILILNTHLRLGFPSGFFPSGFLPRPYTPPILTHTRHSTVTKSKRNNTELFYIVTLIRFVGYI